MYLPKLRFQFQVCNILFQNMKTHKRTTFFLHLVNLDIEIVFEEYKGPTIFTNCFKLFAVSCFAMSSVVRVRLPAEQI